MSDFEYEQEDELSEEPAEFEAPADPLAEDVKTALCFVSKRQVPEESIVQVELNGTSVGVHKSYVRK